MAEEKAEKYVYDSETEELVALESAWFADYSHPPKVGRKWVEEGEEFKTTPRNAKVVLENSLAVTKGTKLPKVPDGLNWSIAAYKCAIQAGFDVKEIKVIGTGLGGKVLIRDVNRTQQALLENSPQFLVVRG